MIRIIEVLLYVYKYTVKSQSETHSIRKYTVSETIGAGGVPIIEDLKKVTALGTILFIITH